MSASGPWVEEGKSEKGKMAAEASSAMGAGVGGGEDSADRNVEMWKIKKLIKSLELARGCEIFIFLFLFRKKEAILK